MVRLRQGEVVCAEGHRGHFKKARASWVGVPRKEISPGIQAGLARPLREQDPEEGDGADQRGHGVSGRSAGDALGRAGLTGWASARHGPSGRRHAGWSSREGRAGRTGPRGKGWAGAGLTLVLGLFSISLFLFLFPFLSTQNYLNSNEFEVKLLYKQTKQNHAPA